VHQVGFIDKDFSCLAATYAFRLPVFKPTVRVSNIQTHLVWHAAMCLNQKPEIFPPCIPLGLHYATKWSKRQYGQGQFYYQFGYKFITNIHNINQLHKLMNVKL
jgi:hypothetical protein